MSSESNRCRHHVAILPRAFIPRLGWLSDVEVRIEWTERRPAPHFDFKADKYYLRAYHGNRIVDHHLPPYATLGAAKRGAKGFLAALRAMIDRAEKGCVACPI